MPHGTPRVPVVLFKTPIGADDAAGAYESDTAACASDPYDDALRGGGFDPAFVPVLEEEYRLDELCAVLRSDDAEWEGVVVTSKRGAEGWIRAASRLTGAGAAHPSEGSEGPAWSDVPLWTVGATSLEVFDRAARAARAAGAAGPDSSLGRYLPRASAGRTAKSASALVPHLLGAPPRSQPPGGAYRRYLVVRGDKALDEIPRALRRAERDCTGITVYATRARTDIARSLSAVLSADDAPLWLAFFSPSSAAYAVDHLPPARVQAAATRVFAIGDTTAAWLRSRGMRVDAMADEPTPGGMLRALLDADQTG